MKKIINGKMYNTDTARKVASCEHGDGPRDFRYYSESLYCKRTGEYFPAPESGERVVLSISMDAATADRIRKEAAAAGLSVSALIASKF